MAYDATSHGLFFPRAAGYARPPGADETCVREDRVRQRDFPWSERHLQCVWYDAGLRPPGLRTGGGEAVEVEDPGVWNLEAGPDFLGARLRIGGRRIAGDVEVHIHPRDWRQHGHGRDPRYHQVRVHLTYFPETTPTAELPAGAVRIALKPALAAQPYFSFETVDPAAYPFGARATPAPCSLHLRRLDADGKIRLLEAAGEERMRRKAGRLSAAMQEKDRDQVLYEEILGALGFKHNKRMCRGLAERVPLARLRETGRGDSLSAYALLCGVAGLLPERQAERWDRKTRDFVRALWDRWWKLRSTWDARLLSRGDWRLSGVRPANRPERRLMAAVHLFLGPIALSDQWLALAARDPGNVAEHVQAALAHSDGSYWDHRLTWGGKQSAKPVALIGESLARAIVANVLVPFLAAAAARAPFERGLLRRLPPEGDNQVVRQTARSLFGPDYPPSLLRDGLRQQGLIQIFHDYCLNDRSRCSDCTFPELLQKLA